MQYPVGLACRSNMFLIRLPHLKRIRDMTRSVLRAGPEKRGRFSVQVIDFLPILKNLAVGLACSSRLDGRFSVQLKSITY